MPFKTLGLIEPLVQAVRSEGYTLPTPVQQQAIPPILQGHDVLGCAQTGTGKTAAFALPIIQRLHQWPAALRGKRGRPVQALILAPTRELAAQIGDSFAAYGRHTGLGLAVIFGGVKQGPQERALRQGADIVVATPGRLLDLMGQGLIDLSAVKVFVLDEADRMLDMGFIHDIRRIVDEVPAKRQTLLFSATMPREILGLAGDLLRNPVEVRIDPEAPAASLVEHSAYRVESSQKPALLDRLLSDPAVRRVLVFSRTKRGADRVARRLSHGGTAAEAIHSNKTQGARQRALESFRKGKTRVLVASDIAARGIDVDGISHVINYDMPGDAETYVHRIGRTGRAGAQGLAISFYSSDQHGELRNIERLLGKKVAVLRPDIELPAASVQRPSPAPKSVRSRRQKAAATVLSETPDSPRPASTPQQAKDNFWKSKRGRHRRRMAAGSRIGK